MKKNMKHPTHSVCFQERPLVIAVRHALPYLVGLSLALAMVQTASSRSSDSAAAFTATQLVRQFTLKNTVSQVSMGMQGYISEINGEQRGPAMGARPAGFPSDMGSVPATVNLPRRDGAGRPLGYCAWDNAAAVTSADYNAGQGVSNPLVYAIVSPGLNGNMQTTCANVLAAGVGVGDDHVQVVAPMQVSSVQYKSSVATFSDLPPGAEGDIRLVRDTNKLYSYVGGAWAPVQAGPFEADGAGGAGAIAYTTGKVTVAEFQAATATITGATTIGGALSGSSATFTGAVTANTFTGNGAGLVDLNADNFSTGVVSPQFGGTGVNGAAAANGTLLIGNGTGYTLGTLTAGTGVGIVNGAGTITISNTGVTSLAGTANQVNVSAATGAVTLSLPQDIATTSTPTFGGMTLNGGLTGTTATFSGAVTVGSLGAQRLDVGTSAGGVTYPNVIVGTGAMPGAQSGFGANTALGIDALKSNTTGHSNTSIGDVSLYSNTTGYRNVALGRGAMYYNTTGYRNAGVGQAALHYNTTGYYNASVGASSLYYNTTGDENSSVGGNSLANNLTGNRNSALGYYADVLSGALNYGTAIGADSRVGTSNTIVLGALGSNKKVSLSTVDDQIVIGATSRSDTFANTKLYVNGVTNLNGDLRGTTANFSGNVALNTSGFAGNTSMRDLRLYSSTSVSPWDHLQVRVDGFATTFNAGGADSGLVFRVGNTNSGDVGGQTYNTVLTLNSNQSAVFAGAVTANSFSGNGSALTNLNASNITTGTVPVARGGTGLDGSAAANGSLLIGNGTGYTLGTLTAGAGIGITNGAGTITLSNTGVTSLAGTANQVNVSAATGAVTLSLPQSIATTSTPTFGGINSNGAITFNPALGNKLNLHHNGFLGALYGFGVNTSNLTAYIPSPGERFSLRTGGTYTGPEVFTVTGGGLITSTGGISTTTGAFSGNVTVGGSVQATGLVDAYGGVLVRDGSTLEFGPAGSTSDQVFIQRSNSAVDQSRLQIILGDNNEGFGVSTTDEFQIGNNAGGTFTPRFRVAGSGDVIAGGSVTANSFSGNGSALTNLNANNFTAGTLPVARGGTGLSATPTNGQLLIGNGTGYTLGTLTGTANQVNVTNGAGSITLSLPQNIATTSVPTFAGQTLTGGLTGTTATFSSDLTASTLQSLAFKAITSQGAHLQWNRDSAGGRTYLVNQKGGGGGGISFGESTTGNVYTENMALSSTGNLTVVGSVTANSVQAGAANFSSMTLTGALTGTSGTFSGDVTTSSLQANSFKAISSQGTYLQWNREIGAGKTYLVNQKGSGGGGISFGESTTGNAYTENMALSATGNLTVVGSVTANSFGGNGSALTNLNANNFTTGTLPVARGGTGLSATPTNGQLLVGNGTGYSLNTLTGTANQVNVTNGAGTITLSLPQAIATTSTPTFGGLTVTGSSNLNGPVRLAGGAPGQFIFIGQDNPGGGSGDSVYMRYYARPSEGENTTFVIGSDSVDAGDHFAFMPSNGNVGIGTVTPGAKLDVVGTANFSGNTNVGGTLGVTGGTTLTGALTANGGINSTTGAFSGLALAASLQATTATAINVQGAYLQWNRDGGRTFLVNQKGLGGGGLSFGESTTGNAYTENMALSSTGNLTVVGAITASGGTFNGAVAVNNSAITFNDVLGDKLNLYSGFGFGINGNNLTAYVPTATQRFSVRTGGTSTGTEVFSVTGGGNTTVSGTLAVTGATTLTGALAANGGITGTTGTFSGAATVGSLFVRGSQAIGVQGSYLHWNRGGGDGRTYLVNQKGGGGGGISFGEATIGDVYTQNMLLDSVGNLSVAGAFVGTSANFSGNTTVGGTLAVTGATTLNGGVAVNNSAITFNNVLGDKLNLFTGYGFGINNSNLTAYIPAATERFSVRTGGNFNGTEVFSVSGGGNTTVGGTLGVTGATTLNGNLNATTASFSGATTLNGAVAVSNSITFNNVLGDKLNLFTGYGFGINGSNLTAYVPNATTRFSVRTGGTSTGTEVFSVSGGGNTTVSGTLGVTGATILTGALTANGGISSTTGAFSGLASAASLQATTATAINVQGAYLQWNRDGGRTFLVNQKGLGGGGISFGEVTTSNAYTENMALSSTGNLTVVGAVTANSFSGNGSALTNLNASNFTTGTVPVARGGTGLSATPTNGQLLIGNGTGYTLGTLTGTANQVNVINGAGSITLSLPQAIATTSTPTFGGMTLNGAMSFNNVLGDKLNLFTGYGFGINNANLTAYVPSATQRFSVRTGGTSTGTEVFSVTGGGNTSVSGTLGVTGATTLNGNLNATSANFSGNTTISGVTTLNNSVLVNNSIIQFNAVDGDKLKLWGNFGFGINTSNINVFVPGPNMRFSVRSDGNFNGAEGFSVTGAGNTIVGGTLNVAGATALTGALTSNGVTNSNGLININAGASLNAGDLQINSTYPVRFGSQNENFVPMMMYRYYNAFQSSSLRMQMGTSGNGANSFEFGWSPDAVPSATFTRAFTVSTAGNVVAQGSVTATSFTATSDRRLKKNITAQNNNSVLERLEQLQTYSYDYINTPSVGRRIGVIAQEIQSLFPEAVSTSAENGMMSVDYNALGAMAAMGVGQLNSKFKVLDGKVNLQGEKLLELDGKLVQQDGRIGMLETWKTAAVTRMDGMQNAIDLNIQKIADNAVAIQTNTKAIERLDEALFTLDGTVKGNTESIANINARWNRNFSASEDGSLLTVNAVELKVSNFTAQQVQANSLYSQRLEAEIARIADLEVNNLRANSAVANTVQAEQVNTGSVQVYAGVGLPAVLFAAKSDGHYTVSTSSLDGSYATATVIVNAGQAKVVSGASEGIELVAEGNMVKAIAAGKSIKASWIKMG